MDIKKMKKNKDIKGLIEALKDEDSYVRMDAVKALGKTGDKRAAVEPLIKALDDEDWEVREAAANALEKMGDAETLKKVKSKRITKQKEYFRLVDELIDIGRTEGFLTSDDWRICGFCGSETVKDGQKRKCTYCGRVQNRTYFKDGKHKRTRQIGERLNKIGGIDLMQAACLEIRNKLGSTDGRTLEVAWGYIGTWLP